MRWPHNVWLLALLLAAGPCAASAAPAKPPAPAAKPSAPPPAPPPAVIPDYGGRDVPGVLAGVGDAAPDPLAQVGRSALALAVVLGGIVGVVTLLKRSGYAGGGGVGPALLAGLRQKPSGFPRTGGGGGANTGPLSLVQSQALPGGGAVHLLSINEKTLVLVGATAQSVSLIAEWEASEEAAPSEAPVQDRPRFSDFLRQADPPLSPPKGPPPRPNQLSDLLASARVRGTEQEHE